MWFNVFVQREEEVEGILAFLSGGSYAHFVFALLPSHFPSSFHAIYLPASFLIPRDLSPNSSSPHRLSRDGCPGSSPQSSDNTAAPRPCTPRTSHTLQLRDQHQYEIPAAKRRKRLLCLVFSFCTLSSVRSFVPCPSSPLPESLALSANHVKCQRCTLLL